MIRRKTKGGGIVGITHAERECVFIGYSGVFGVDPATPDPAPRCTS